MRTCTGQRRLVWEWPCSDRQTDRQTERQTDRQTDRQKERKKERNERKRERNRRRESDRNKRREKEGKRGRKTWRERGPTQANKKDRERERERATALPTCGVSYIHPGGQPPSTLKDVAGMPDVPAPVASCLLPLSPPPSYVCPVLGWRPAVRRKPLNILIRLCLRLATCYAGVFS